MRLIDADKLKEQIQGEGLDGACEYNCIYDAFNIIDSQPTAYDVDRIIDKIGRYKKIMKSNMESSGHDGMSAEYYRGRMNACTDFLEIVKGGGQGE